MFWKFLYLTLRTYSDSDLDPKGAESKSELVLNTGSESEKNCWIPNTGLIPDSDPLPGVSQSLISGPFKNSKIFLNLLEGSKYLDCITVLTAFAENVYLTKNRTISNYKIHIKNKIRLFSKI